MKTLIMVLAIVGGLTATVHAEETMGEKAQATTNDAGRAMKKGAHRAKEAVCMKSDAKCLAEKAKHRGQEAGDAIGDKASEVKNNVDKK
ncbi:MAG: hypothetical protein H7256_16035 [Bdellovibrio sp.]|nr:hypothetical protein [Bdellovibrio sp.]